MTEFDADAFMRHVFGGWKAVERPVIATQYEGGVPASPWPETTINGHTHYSVGLVTYPQHPNFLRRNATWTGAKLLILDDIYEKAVPPCVEPTFKIETKPESQQWGYVFREPMRNATDFETLVESCIVAGLGDPGAKGRIRLARLPGSMPPGKRHRAKLIWADWNRSAKPDVDLFLKKLGINKVKKGGDLYGKTPLGFDPGEDEMLNWLFTMSLVIGNPQGGGWYPILCPWVQEHTGADPSGTRYHAPSQEDGTRSFKCHHAHCQNLDFFDFVHAYRTLGGPLVATMPRMFPPGHFDKPMEVPEFMKEMLREDGHDV